MSDTMKARVRPLPGNCAMVQVKEAGRYRYDRVLVLEHGQVPGGGFERLTRPEADRVAADINLTGVTPPRSKTVAR